MIRQHPAVFEKIWGYEKWCVSSHKAGESLDDDGKTLSSISDYPLLIKIIKSAGALSVQVHPDDDYAAKFENSSGKTECWYVLEAEKNARIICGLRQDIDPVNEKSELKSLKPKLKPKLKRIFTEGNKKEIEQVLNFVPVNTGDLVYIPAGQIHALLGGVRLLEIQQSSDLTYRLYDWGRGRELQIERGIDVVRHERPEVIRNFTGAFNSKYFSLEFLQSAEAGPAEAGPAVFPLKKDDALFIAQGSGLVRVGTSAFKVQQEEFYYIKDAAPVTFNKGIKILKISPAGG